MTGLLKVLIKGATRLWLLSLIGLGLSANAYSQEIVGQSELPDGSVHAFLWKHGVMTDLGTLGGSYSYAIALGINASGQVVGTSSAVGGQHAFLWKDGVMTDLGTLGGTRSIAHAINDLGQVLGVSSLPGDIVYHPFLWENGVMIDLDALGLTGSYFGGLNASGHIVGSTTDQNHGFFWDGVMHELVDSVRPGFPNSAWGINDSDQVVGRQGIGVDHILYSHAALWVNNVSVEIDLGTLGGESSEAHAINSLGQIVGFSETATGGSAFLWDGGMVDLGTLGGCCADAYGINNFGEIAGGSTLIGSPYISHAFLWKNGVMTDLGTLGGSNSWAWGINGNHDEDQNPEILTPTNGSHPRSRYVAMTGAGQPGRSIDLLVDNIVVSSTGVETDGRWEAVVEPGSGPHQLNAEYTGATDVSNTVNVLMDYVSPPTQLTDTSPFLALRKADILVTSSPDSCQKLLYGANYTHTALYLGGDTDGTPLIAEAVTSTRIPICPVDESFGLSEVRALPLDVSTVYQIFPTRVAVFRPLQDLTPAQRDAIVGWARATGARGLPYWTLADFGPIADAWALWPLGLWQDAMAEVRNNTWSTDKFICSTLVWRAYLEGTGGGLDLLQPNLMTVDPDSLLGYITDPAFIDVLGQNFLVPETFVRSPKLHNVSFP